MPTLLDEVIHKYRHVGEVGHETLCHLGDGIAADGRRTAIDGERPGWRVKGSDTLGILTTSCPGIVLREFAQLSRNGHSAEPGGLSPGFAPFFLDVVQLLLQSCFPLFKQLDLAVAVFDVSDAVLKPGGNVDAPSPVFLDILS